MTRLFGCSIGCHLETESRLKMKNVQVVKDVDLWWNPTEPGQITLWESSIVLSQDFYDEIIDRPVPIDMRALEALRRSPMALDIYTWLTYRMSYLSRQTAISWEQLQNQFGAGYAFSNAGKSHFQQAFRKHLKSVLTVYPEANIDQARGRLILKPSKPHIAKR